MKYCSLDIKKHTIQLYKFYKVYLFRHNDVIRKRTTSQHYTSGLISMSCLYKALVNSNSVIVRMEY